MQANKILYEVMIDSDIYKRLKEKTGIAALNGREFLRAVIALLNANDAPGENNRAYHSMKERIEEEAQVFANMEKPDNVNNPAHYTQGGMECIEEMMLIFGSEETKIFCKLNAWKYRKRALYKGTPEKDMAKSDAYLRCYKSIKENGVADFKEGVKHD